MARELKEVSLGWLRDTCLISAAMTVLQWLWGGPGTKAVDLGWIVDLGWYRDTSTMSAALIELKWLWDGSGTKAVAVGWIRDQSGSGMDQGPNWIWDGSGTPHQCLLL